MRITALHLTAYGHFTDRVLTFGEAAGLHLVYGDNEAGKTTTLRALSSVLFGYPHAVVDGFRHGAKDIALGADLCAADGSTLSFVRRRRGRALMTADGAALEERAVAQFLGGVSQDVFEKVFALDHPRLRAHAKALLADGGSLGFSLAEAGSGVAGLKAVLDRLRSERRGLFLPTGSQPKLNQAISELTRLRKEARQSTVSPADYRSREKRLQEIEDQLRDRRAQCSALEAGMARLERIRRNLPLRAQYRVLSREIADLAGVPVLPAGFAETRITTTAERDAARTDITDAVTEIENLGRRIAGITVDADVVACSADIEAAAGRRPVIARHETEGPRWQAERSQLVAAAAGLMARAELVGGRGSPLEAALAAELPPPQRRRSVQRLAGEGTELMVKRAAAVDDAEDAAAKLAQTLARNAAITMPLPVEELSGALTAADRLGAGIRNDIARRTRALERRTNALTETVTSLGVSCDGGAAAPLASRIARLRELNVPSDATEQRYAARLVDIEGGIREAKGGIGRLNGQIADNDGRLAALKHAGEVVTEDDVSAARDARDRGWKLVRGLYVDCVSGLDAAARRFAPDGDVAGTFAARVGDADRAVDGLRSRVSEATEVRLLERRTGEMNTERDGLIAAVAQFERDRDAVLSQWRALWPAGVITLQAPGEMGDWVRRRSAALAEADALEEERDAVSEIVTREREVSGALAAAMAAFTGEAPGGDVDALRDRARVLVEAASAARSRYEEAATELRTISERKSDADRKVAGLDAGLGKWRDRWQSGLAAADLAPGLTIEEAAAALDVIAEIEGVRSKVADLDRRIADAAAERDVFADAVAGITARLTTVPEGPLVTVCRGLETRLDEARRAAREREGHAGRLAAREADHARAGERLARAEAVLEELCTQAGGVAPGELAETERRSGAKRDAERERERIETRVREDGDGRDVEALFEECDGIDGDEAAARLVALRAERADVDAEVEKLMSRRADLQAEFETVLGHRQAADLEQEAAAVETEIGDAVEDYVNLTVQEALLRRAIEVYRDRNQGPILTRARELFVRLTDGAYSGLRADVEDGETVLLVEDGARRSLELSALSDGTVDAVYLALRLAVVQEHNATREPVPFIADDLLLNLDNRRSEAALRTLAEVAASSQVLLFTHHAHMLDLARRAVPPGVLIAHDLSSPGAAEPRRRAG